MDFIKFITLVAWLISPVFLTIYCYRLPFRHRGLNFERMLILVTFGFITTLFPLFVLGMQMWSLPLALALAYFEVPYAFRRGNGDFYSLKDKKE